MARYLGGSEVGFELPGLGVFHGPNLTPDKATGLGNWTDAQVVAAIQQGHRPDGRMLAPIMPYHAFANLTSRTPRRSLPSCAAFRRSEQGAWSVGPTETPTSFVMKVVPPPAKQ